MSDRALPAGERLQAAFGWGLGGLLSLVLAGVLGLVALTVADFAARPTEWVTAPVASRTWHPPDIDARVASVIDSNGKPGGVLVVEPVPERYEVCLSLEGQHPCAAVRAGRYEALRPGVPVAALIRRGRITGEIRVVRVLDDGE